MLSIQYVYERVCLFYSLVSQSGCKSTNSFWLDKFFEKKIYFSFFIPNLSLLTAFAEGKDNYLLPLYPNLFIDFLSSLSIYERRPDCGCKSNPLLPISKSFLTYFFPLFATNWLIVLCISFIFFETYIKSLYNNNFGVMVSKCWEL